MAYLIANRGEKKNQIFTIPPPLCDEENKKLNVSSKSFSTQHAATSIYDTFFIRKMNESIEREKPSGLRSFMSSIFGLNAAKEGNNNLSKKIDHSSQQNGTVIYENLASIPLPIHSLVRYQYLCGARHSNRIQSFTSSIPTDNTANETEVHGLIGLGLIACFPADGSVRADSVSVGHTSDRNYLLQCSSTFLENNSNQIPKYLDLSHARITSVGSDCICVSWGFDHGIVRIYRKCNEPPKGNNIPISWELLVIISPSASSSEDLGYFITDLRPIIIDSNVAYICIARLNSVVQIVPLPAYCWNNYIQSKRKGVVKIIPNDKNDPKSVFIRTQHEIMNMDIYKGNSDASSFILALAGTSHDNTDASISFWILSIHSEQKSMFPAMQLEYTCLTKLPSVGPNLGTYVTIPHQKEMNTEEKIDHKSNIVHTIPPILQISFSPFDRDEQSLFLAVLDFYGGITMLSCEALLIANNSKTSDCAPYIKIHRHVVSKSRIPKNYIDKTIEIGWYFPRSKSSSSKLPPKLSLVTVSGSGLIQIMELISKYGKTKEIFRHRPVFPSHPDIDLKGKDSIILFKPSELKTQESVNYLHVRGGLNSFSGNEIYGALCHIKQANPLSIVQHLMRGKKYEEALHMSKRYSLSSDPCYKAIWEEGIKSRISLGENVKGTLYHIVKDYLCNVKDDDYVINLALTIQENTLDSRWCAKTISSIFEEAIKRLEQKSSNLEKGSFPKENDQLKSSWDVLRCWFNRLQTYRALTTVWKLDFHAHHFFSTFLHASIFELAKESAVEGDIDTLSILFGIHGSELISYRLHLLELLPPTMSPVEYAFLLPVVVADSESGGCDLFYLQSDQKNKERRLVSSHELWNSLKQKIAFNDEDKINLMLDSDIEPVKSGETIYNVETAGKWYLHQAYHVLAMTGNLHNVFHLCDFGLERLHQAEVNFERNTAHAMNLLESLKSFRSFTFHASSLLADKILFSQKYTMTLNEFMSTDLKKIISSILGTNTDSTEVLSRYKRYVQPMISGPYAILEWKGNERTNDSSDSKDVRNIIREAIVSYGLTRLDEGKKYVEKYMNALSICLMIARLSRTTLPNGIRLLSDNTILLSFVLDCVYFDTSNILARIPMQKYVASLWELYECLPIRDDETNHKCLHDSADTMRCHVIAIDILHRYCIPPSLAEIRNINNDDVLRDIQQTNFGCKLYSMMCNGFCNQVQVEEGQTEVQNQSKAAEFLVDSLELRNHVFLKLPLEKIIETRLIPTLLRSYKFDFVRDFLLLASSKKSYEMDIQKTKVAILNFIQNSYDHSTFSEIDVTGLNQSFDLEHAKKCENVFSALFPEWKSDFTAEKYFLVIIEHIREMECFSVNLQTIRKCESLAIIEQVLHANPASIIKGTKWGHTDFSFYTNRKILLALKSNDHSSIEINHESLTLFNEEMIALPGTMCMKLAKILDVKSSIDLFFIKCRIIHYAINSELYDAASCFCFCLLMGNYEEDMERDTNEEQFHELSLNLLKNVLRLVKAVTFTDIEMKKELSSAALVYSKVYFGNRIDCTCIHEILEQYSYCEVDTMISRLGEIRSIETAEEIDKESIVESFNSQNMRVAEKMEENQEELETQEHSNFLVFKAAGLFAKKARNLADQVQKQQLVSVFGMDKGLDIIFPKDGLLLFLSSCSKHVAQLRLHQLKVLHENIIVDEQPSQNFSLLNTIAVKTLDESISHSLKIRYDSDCSFDNKHKALPPYDVLAMIQYGCSLLLAAKDDNTNRDLVKKLIETVEDKAAEALQALSEEIPDSSIIPDEDVVRRLCAYGYEVNGARRSAIMTNNSGFNAALGWAISHFEDDDFNHQIISRSMTSKSFGTKTIDQALVYKLRLALHLIAGIMDGNNLYSIMEKDCHSAMDFRVEEFNLGFDEFSSTNQAVSSHAENKQFDKVEIMKRNEPNDLSTLKPIQTKTTQNKEQIDDLSMAFEQDEAFFGNSNSPSSIQGNNSIPIEHLEHSISQSISDVKQSAFIHLIPKKSMENEVKREALKKNLGEAKSSKTGSLLVEDVVTLVANLDSTPKERPYDSKPIGIDSPTAPLISNKDIIQQLSPTRRKILRERGEMLAKENRNTKTIGSERRKMLLEEGRRALQEARLARKNKITPVTKKRNVEVVEVSKEDEVSSTLHAMEGTSQSEPSLPDEAQNVDDQASDVEDGWDFDDFE